MNKNIDKLLKENSDLAAKNKVLKIENTGLKQELETLKFTLSKFNRHIFGTSSEKIIKETEEERNLFNLNEAENNQNLNAVEPTIDKVIKKRKPKTTKAES